MRKKALKKVAIVVPVYKPLNYNEIISLAHLKQYLAKYDKFMILPKTLTLTNIPTSGFQIIKFPDSNFSSVSAYSSFMNTKNFYSQFTNYEYILIYQLDALVFSDQLLKWCDKGYDYIGAPWFNHTIGNLCHQKGSPANIGNGGFSLRKVSSFLKVIEEAEKVSKRKTENHYLRKLWFIQAALSGRSHKKWLHAPPSCYPFNEDGFWAFEAPKYVKDFKIAPFEEALKFAFEKDPRKCYELNNSQIPFGCHAWFRYDKKFWIPFLLPDPNTT